MIKISQLSFTHTDIFTSFLFYLEAKHTKSFSSRFYKEHPYKDSLYGISKMLSEYGIDNVGFVVDDKELRLKELSVPFIAHFKDQFVLVYKITADQVFLILNNRSYSMPFSEFCNIWTGVVLVANVDSSSIEPGYKANRKKDMLAKSIKITILSVCVLFFLVAFFESSHNTSLPIVGLLLFNTIGAYICFLLAKKQLNIQSKYADKICSAFTDGDCNNILKSKEAKFLGVFSWSEIGLGYFISNILGIMFFPKIGPNITIINSIVLIFSLWSFWHQKYVAKQWCPLCLIVQFIFCMVFFINLYFGFIQEPVLNVESLVYTFSLFALPLLTLHLLLPYFQEKAHSIQLVQELNSLKAREDVFLTLIRKQPFYAVDKSTSMILFGNPKADTLVTILTNPHCIPCAEMHERVNYLLKQTKDTLCIQYIFTSFNETLWTSNKGLISIYLNEDKVSAHDLFDEWFKTGNRNKNKFFTKHCVKSRRKDIVSEFVKHEQWIKKSGLKVTPTILINGYQFPSNYKIEDLRYFETLKI